MAAGILTEAEAEKLRAVDEKVMYLIHVDDFAQEELGPIFQAKGKSETGTPKRKPRQSKESTTEAAEA